MSNSETFFIPNIERSVNLNAPILEQIPEYAILGEADGTGVRVSIRGKSGKTYDVEIACMFVGDATAGEYVFGMWEANEDKLIPLGLMTCTTTEATPNEAHMSVSHSSYIAGDEKFLDLDMIAAEGGDQALRIARNYQGEGFAPNLCAISYAVLEARGVEKLKILGDLTLRENPLGVLKTPENLPLVQGTRNIVLNSTQTIVQPEKYTSMYTKYATRGKEGIKSHNGYEETIVGTHLSGPQVSMLLENIK